MANNRDNPVRKSRLAKGWTQRELTQKADVSTGTISKAENGHDISDLKKQKIADALGKPVDELFPPNSE